MPRDSTEQEDYGARIERMEREKYSKGVSHGTKD